MPRTNHQVKKETYMKLSKSMLAAGVVTTVAIASVAGIGAASAHSNGNDSIVDRIATKFNLNREEVQTVFDEQHEKMEAERKQEQETRLQELVDNGTLTEEQKTALQAKREEMHAKMEALRDQDLTHEEIHTQMETAREEFKTWAESQGIDLSTIHPEGMGHRGPRGGFEEQN
jgi:competence protein ComGC